MRCTLPECLSTNIRIVLSRQTYNDQPWRASEFFAHEGVWKATGADIADYFYANYKQKP